MNVHERVINRETGSTLHALPGQQEKRCRLPSDDTAVNTTDTGETDVQMPGIQGFTA